MTDDINAARERYAKHLEAISTGAGSTVGLNESPYYSRMYKCMDHDILDADAHTLARAYVAAPVPRSLEACRHAIRATVYTCNDGEEDVKDACLEVVSRNWPAAPSPSEATEAIRFESLYASQRLTIERLHAELSGLRASDELYRKGMESQAELMDGLKQENRRLAAENKKLHGDVEDIGISDINERHAAIDARAELAALSSVR